MVKINGVEATNNFEIRKQNLIKPTIKEILDRMENNYQNINNVDSQSFSNKEPSKNKIEESNRNDAYNSSSQNNSANTLSSLSNMLQADKNINQLNDGDGNDNLLLSILPMMLSKNKGVSTLKNSENIIFKELLKKSNNTRLMQLAELLPKIMSKKNIDTETLEEEVSNEPIIESYTKTTDFKE